MFEHIKTSRQIRESLPVPTVWEVQAGGEELIVEIEKLLNRKWVSLDWLREQLKNHSLHASQVQGIFNRQIEDSLEGKPLTDELTDWISINELKRILEG